jgi:hypothetical protein
VNASDFSRFTLVSCVAAAVLATLSARPAYGAQASAADRARMSLAIADYLHIYGDKSGLPRFPWLGWAVVERPWALAKWHSGESPVYGVVLFKYSGSVWNVEDVSKTIPAQKQHLIEQGVPASTAGKLVADLAELDAPRDPWMTAYASPGHYRPKYLALDYGKPGQPILTAKEIARIRKVLALVKPCQRALIEYAFPENSDWLPFILFFEAPSVDSMEGSYGHPFGQSGNVYYNEGEGLVQPVPYDSRNPPPGDLGYDIAHTPCP